MSRSDLCTIRKVIDQFDWAGNPVTVAYSKAITNVDKPGKSSMVVDVTEQAQQDLLALWNKVEAKINEAGVAGVYNRDKSVSCPHPPSCHTGECQLPACYC